MTETSIAESLTDYPQVIDGIEVPLGEHVIERTSPMNARVVSRYRDGGAEDVDAAVAAARRAFDSGIWSQINSERRSRILMAWADAIADHREEIARIDAAEAGKSVREALVDTDSAIGHVRFAATLAQSVHGDVHTNLDQDFVGLMVREPIGVVGAIVPWNFPVSILCQKVPYALAAGCTVVAKPSEYTSGSAVVVARLALGASVPAGVFNVVTGAGAAGQALAQHMDVDMISFTGSTATGRRILQASASNMKKTSLELGGKAAQIVFADADLDDAVEGVTFGAVYNAGQCCVAGARLLVQDSIADEFERRLANRFRELHVASSIDDARSDLGSVIHAEHRAAVLAAVRTAVDEGAMLVTGGSALEDSGHKRGQFVQPTLIVDVTPAMTLFNEEVFGPVLSVTRFVDVDDAVRLCNAVKYGLGNTIWSKDVDKVMDVSRRLRSGTVYVNTTIDGSPQLSFGGYKASGYGREMGRLGLDEFCEVKTIQIRTGKRSASFGLTR